jgi:glyoxylase-like metal-dependent hydrolase (beta-lactamase superfamily II)
MICLSECRRKTPRTFVLCPMLRLALLASALLSTAHAAFDELAPDLFRWESTCNSYVLRDGDAALIIDLGDGRVLDHISEIGVKRVEQVLFTSHHRELLEGVSKLDRSQTQIAAPKEEQELFESPSRFRQWHPRLGDKFTVHGSSYVRPPARPIPVDRWLADGDVIQWHGRTLRCHSTPGHSPGGMSFTFEDQLFLGGLMHDGSKMTNWFDSEWDYGFAKGLDASSHSRRLKTTRGLPSASARFPTRLHSRVSGR